jgi:phosphoglycerate kinase
LIVNKPSLRTLDRAKTKGKKVFLRLDMNLPLDPNTGRILDDTRITRSIPTIKRLSDSALVIASHQSRPMKSDFSSMEKHADIISKRTGRPVTYVPDVIGPAAVEAISRLQPGKALVLDNLRLCSEENYNADPKTLVKTRFVRTLAPLFDIYVNDAFAASHRSQPSLAGLPQLVEPYAGKLMEEELLVFSRLMRKAASPRTLCLGGAKLETKLSILETTLRNDSVDHVLVSGLTGIAFLRAAGHDVGRVNSRVIETGEQLLLATRILESFADRVVLPVDVAVIEEGHRVECTLDEINNRPIMDIGPETTQIFAHRVAEAKSLFANGPTGFFEMDDYKKGTHSLLLAIAMSRAGVKVLGGGHLGSMAAEIGMSRNLHISTGGGVILALLGGEELPTLSVLTNDRHKKS